MAYNSDIDLRLGEVPKTTDPAIFPDMLEIYAAIHILGQWTNAIKENADSGGSDKLPHQAMPFRNWFYTEAARDISSGDVVTIVDYDKFSDDPKLGTNKYSLKGAINGANIGGLLNWEKYLGGYVYPMQGSITGLALNTVAAGELVQIGIGPAIMKVDGLKAGEPVFVEAAYTFMGNPGPVGLGTTMNPWARENNRGGLLRLEAIGQRTGIVGEIVCVGRGVAPDSMMFCPPGNWDTTENLNFFVSAGPGENPGGDA